MQTAGLEIVKQLGLVHWVQGVDSLAFDYHLANHYQIRLVVSHYDPFI
jgi:hypothetical protein